MDALDALGDARSRLRVEVLARVAAVLHFAGQPEEAITVSAEALALAEDLGDDDAVLAALHGRQAALMGVDHLAERWETLDCELALAERRGELEHVALTCQARLYTHLEEGALDAARAELDRYAAVSALMHRPPVEHGVLAWRAVMAQLDGALDEAEQLAWQGHALAHRVYIADADALLASQLCFIRRDQVRLAELVPILEASATSDPVDLSWRAGATIALAGAGDRARARAAFEVAAREGFADVPRDFWWLARMTLFAEGAALVGDPRTPTGSTRRSSRTPTGTRSSSSPPTSAACTGCSGCWPRGRGARTARSSTSRSPGRATSAWVPPRWRCAARASSRGPCARRDAAGTAGGPSSCSPTPRPRRRARRSSRSSPAWAPRPGRPGPLPRAFRCIHDVARQRADQVSGVGLSASARVPTTEVEEGGTAILSGNERSPSHMLHFRRSPRVRVDDLSVTVHSSAGRDRAYTVRDLSTGGMLVEGLGLPVGSELVFALEGTGADLSGRGHVAHAASGRAGVAVDHWNGDAPALPAVVAHASRAAVAQPYVSDWA